MKFKFRKSQKIGPIKLNFTERGFSSWGIKIGPFSWSSKTRKKKIDTPGPGHVEL